MEGQERGCSFQRYSRWELGSKTSPFEGVGPTAGWDTLGKRNKVITLLEVWSQFGCPAFILITMVTKLSQLINLERYLESRLPNSVMCRGHFSHQYETSTRSPLLTWLSLCVQSGRWSSFGKWVWFSKSNIDLVIYFYMLFYLLNLFLI
jgi:hypothetical protein